MDYHILAGNTDGNSFTVVFHVPIPDQNNQVGKSYRQVIVAVMTTYDENGVSLGIPSQVPFITPAEQAQLNAGEIVETTWSFHTHPGETLLQKRDRIDAAHGAAVARVQAEWAHRLAYYGYSRDVP